MTSTSEMTNNNTSQSQAHCFLCLSSQEDALQACPDCDLVWSCGPDHYRIHKTKQGKCLPFKVAVSEVKGRVLVAVRNIKPFELILEDRTTVFGPYETNSDPVCIVCLALVEPDEACPECGLSMCSERRQTACHKSPIHEFECQVFSSSGKKRKATATEMEPVSDMNLIYGSIMPLRMMVAQRRDAQLWPLLERLQSHVEERRGLTSGRNLIRCAERILASPLISEQDLGRLDVYYGQVKTNSLGYGSVRGLCKGHALFPCFSLLCHSCVCNCRYAAEKLSPEDNDGKHEVVVHVRAQRAIECGDELTVQYKSSLLGNSERKCVFPINWLFQCTCIRDGLRLLMRSAAAEVVADLKTRIKTVAYFDPLDDWDELLREAQTRLSEDHYLAMDIKRVIIQILGARPELKLKQLTDQQLRRKISYCENYLHVYGKVDPGFTKWRGRILEELVGPQLLLAKRRLSRGEIDKASFDAAMKLGLCQINEAFKCRQYEFGASTVQLGAIMKEFNDIVASD